MSNLENLNFLLFHTTIAIRFGLECHSAQSTVIFICSLPIKPRICGFQFLFGVRPLQFSLSLKNGCLRTQLLDDWNFCVKGCFFTMEKFYWIQQGTAVVGDCCRAALPLVLTGWLLEMKREHISRNSFLKLLHHSRINSHHRQMLGDTKSPS